MMGSFCRYPYNFFLYIRIQAEGLKKKLNRSYVSVGNKMENKKKSGFSAAVEEEKKSIQDYKGKLMWFCEFGREKKNGGRRGQSALLLIPPLESFCQDPRDLPLMGQIQIEFLEFRNRRSLPAATKEMYPP